MRAPFTVAVSVVLAALALGWALRLHEPPTERVTATDERSTPGDAAETQNPVPTSPEPDPAEVTSNAISNDDPIDAEDRARFTEEAREFFAQAPALSNEEARRRADLLGQELSRIERAGGMSAGETFLLRVGLIRAAEPDERRQAEQIRALKERYEIERRERTAGAQPDPMFQLYKVREREIIDEVMALQTIPGGLSREEYLRRRLQEAREQLLGGAM